MKRRTTILLLTIGMVASLAAGCAVVGISAGLEQPDYEVTARLGDDVEVRSYPARTYAESRTPANDPDARSNAFRLLFNYIAGANAGKTEIEMTIPVATAPSATKIDMTAPVSTAVSSSDYVMRFFLPAQFTEETAPVPDNPRVSIGTVPARTEAVLIYSGAQSDALAEEKQRALLSALAGSGWKPVGKPEAYFYNPPFSVPFLRRNEAVVTVSKK